MYQQQTLRTITGCTGVGLHSGRSVRLKLHPMQADQGIVFERTDITGRPRIKATPQNVIATDLASTIGNNGVRVGTVEHLLAALYGTGIDNVLVEIDGDEIPIMDGSAYPFLSLIKSAGIRRLSSARKFFQIRKSITIKEGDRFISVHPCKNFRISFTIDFDHPFIEEQNMTFDFSTGFFEQHISPARTFGFLHELQTMNARGLAKGAGMHNAVVVDKLRVLNEEGLRFPDEFVRHKILDQVGDLALLGGPILGHIQAFKSGHELNHKFIKALQADPSIYDVINFDQEDDADFPDTDMAAWSAPDRLTA